jgi:hypothetical protein
MPRPGRPPTRSGWTEKRWRACLPIAAGAKLIFVAAQGRDTEDGSQARPVRTLARAAKAIDPSRQNVILLEAGGLWPEAIPSLPSGPAPDRPTIVAMFGQPGRRPRLRTPGNMASWQVNASNLFFADLDLDPQAPYAYGLRFLSCRDVQVLGCRLRGFRFNCTFEGVAARRGARLLFARNVVCRRARPRRRRRLRPLRLRHGRRPDRRQPLRPQRLGDGGPGTMRNHNLYVTGDCTDLAFQGNLSARASSHGLQARCGGLVADSLFLDNAIGLSYGLVEGDGPVTAGGVAGTIADNAIVGGRDIGTQKRGMGLQLGNTKSVDVVRNLFLDELHAGAYPAISLEACGPGLHAGETIGVHGLRLEGNAVRNWQTPIKVEAGLVVGGTGPKSCDLLAPATFNRLPAGGPTVDDYARSIGLKDRAELLARAREQTRAKWDDRLTAGRSWRSSTRPGRRRRRPLRPAAAARCNTTTPAPSAARRAWR